MAVNPAEGYAKKHLTGSETSYWTVMSSSAKTEDGAMLRKPYAIVT
ncbi:MAG: hypothetical protein WC785_08315 [Tatlockia sp.]|jgi:hypothetical protein